MPLELDHFFICASVGAPEAERLMEFGLTEGAPNNHPGQGTANRRFFFRNTFLELIWVADPVEAQSSAVRRTGLWDRWSRRSSGCSPFGIGFRPSSPGSGGIPFETWEYRPPYLPAPLVLHMGANSEIATEPLLFYLDFNRRPDAGTGPRRQPLDHRIGLREVSRLRVSLAQTPISALLQAAERHCASVHFVHTGEDLLEVGFDGEVQGRFADFRPELPLLFRW